MKSKNTTPSRRCENMGQISLKYFLKDNVKKYANVCLPTFKVKKKWSSAKLSLNRDLSLNKMSLNRDCTVLYAKLLTYSGIHGAKLELEIG